MLIRYLLLYMLFAFGTWDICTSGFDTSYESIEKSFNYTDDVNRYIEKLIVSSTETHIWGYASGMSPAVSYLLYEMDITLNIVWNQRIGQGNMYRTGFLIDNADSNLYFTYSNFDWTVVRLTSGSGTVVWAKKLPTVTNCPILAINSDDSKLYTVVSDGKLIINYA